jgi:hypothetical protein
VAFSFLLRLEEKSEAGCPAPLFTPNRKHDPKMSISIRVRPASLTADIHIPGIFIHIAGILIHIAAGYALQGRTLFGSQSEKNDVICFVVVVLIFSMPIFIYRLCFEHVDGLGTYSIRPETSLFNPL